MEEQVTAPVEEQMTKEQMLTSLYNYAARLLIDEDKNSEEVIKALIEKGVSRENATRLVDKLIVEIEEAQNSRANKDMLYGALWCIGGLLVTAISYAATGGGGRYVLAWGAILFGGIQFVRGMMRKYN